MGNDMESGDAGREGEEKRRSRRRGSRNSEELNELRKFLVITEKGEVDHLVNPLTAGSYIVFDIETTGGNPSHNGITEIFALRFENGAVKDSFYSMVNPKIRIPGIVRRMTGISNQMVKDAPTIDQVMPRFVAFAAGGILVSHNTIGDIKFLRYFSHETVGAMMDNYFLCTHLLAEKLIPESKDKSLKGLSTHLNHLTDHEIHRAEGDARLTLELFKIILQRLAKKGITTIADAIRYQGDYESAVRLGWGIQAAALRALPRQPGVFFLYDCRDKVQFLSSANNISREVRRLATPSLLPRAMLKAVLASCRISFETTDTPFWAAVREAEVLCDNKVAFDPIDWHQRIASFIYVVRDGKSGMRLAVGPIEPGAQVALGPVRSSVEVMHYVQDLAGALGVPATRRGFCLNASKGRVLVAFLRGKKMGLCQSLLDLLPLSALKSEKTSRAELYKRLLAVVEPLFVHPLDHLTGILVFKDHDLWFVYRVLKGRAELLSQTTEEFDGWFTPERAANIGRDLARKNRSLGPKWPLKAKEAHEISRVAWWVAFGARKMQGRFIALDELLAKS